MNIRIRKAQSRLDTKASDEVEQLLNPEKDEFEEKRAIIDVQMKNLIQKMEEFGEQGKIKEVQEINGQLEMLKAENERLRMAEESNPLIKQDKKMEVCQVCGSLLVMNDASKRLETHFEGKQHIGYQKVWEAYELLKQKFPDYHDRLERGGPRKSYSSNYTSSQSEYSRERSTKSYPETTHHDTYHSSDRYDRSSSSRRQSSSGKDYDHYGGNSSHPRDSHYSKYGRREGTDRQYSDDRYRERDRDYRRGSRH